MNNSLYTPNITVIRTDNTFNLQSNESAVVDKSEIEKTITMCSINVDDEMEEFSIFLYTFFFSSLQFDFTSFSSRLSLFSNFNVQPNEDPRTENLRKFSYGIILPIICTLGILGNVLNLIVLTRRNMRGTAYIYMRGEWLAWTDNDGHVTQLQAPVVSDGSDKCWLCAQWH